MTATEIWEEEKRRRGEEETGNGELPFAGDAQTTAYNLGSVEQIPLGEGRQFCIAGIQIAVFRARSGGIYATQAACPHRNGPLIDGLLGGHILVCPLHAWKWELTNGYPLMGDCALTTYPARLTEKGEIEVCV